MYGLTLESIALALRLLPPLIRAILLELGKEVTALCKDDGGIEKARPESDIAT